MASDRSLSRTAAFATVRCPNLHAPLLVAFAVLLLVPYARGEVDLSQYLYEDTKQLVRLVEDAAALMERDGTAAFSTYRKPGSRWFNEKYYFFVYDGGGTCVFHAVSPELVGKNLMDFRDMHGKPVIRYITDVGRQPARDARGWVFYLWPDKDGFVPKWKGAYIRKVVAPDGRHYLIGSGIYEPKMERVFVQQNVQRAAELLAREGKEAAFRAFRDLASPFSFLDTYVYVTDEQGRTVVDPAFPQIHGRNLSGIKDAIGRPVMAEIAEKLRNHDEAWAQYLWPKPGAALPSRKLVYARKIRVGGETLVLGSTFFLASPIWMKQ